MPMIVGEIRRYLRDNNTIRVSRSLRDNAYRALKAREALTYKLGREPEINEIAHEIELSPEEVSISMDAIQEPVSLFEPIYQEGGDPICVMDQVKDEKINVDNWIRDLLLQQALGHLSKRESTVIERRYFNGRTQMEVAEEIGISQAQVSRLEKSALKQMRKYV